MDFYTDHPTPTTAWRLAVLMGANTRTYKFALGSALLQYAAEGRTEVTLEELATPYAYALVRHASEMPQARLIGRLGAADFLTVVSEEAGETLRIGKPTEKLREAAMRSMPRMVMQKFHNLAGNTEVPHRFYEVVDSPRRPLVRLTPSLLSVAESEEVHHLTGELDARWQIVETSFSLGIGASLVSEGFAVDLGLSTLIDKRRRRSVVGVTEAVIGFQHGRCLICDQLITPEDAVAVDHVFPFSLMTRGSASAWRNLDVDAMWNLAPAHSTCNSLKSNRVPNQIEVQRLAARNVAIMSSPHPLRRTLELTLQIHGYRGRANDWIPFIRSLLP